ncbi:hypothetical protein BJ508DRAFT_316462, partial [Ascobolus immersus RN42]
NSPFNPSAVSTGSPAPFRHGRSEVITNPFTRQTTAKRGYIDFTNDESTAGYATSSEVDDLKQQLRRQENAAKVQSRAADDARANLATARSVIDDRDKQIAILQRQHADLERQLRVLRETPRTITLNTVTPTSQQQQALDAFPGHLQELQTVFSYARGQMDRLSSSNPPSKELASSINSAIQMLEFKISQLQRSFENLSFNTAGQLQIAKRQFDDVQAEVVKLRADLAAANAAVEAARADPKESSGGSSSRPPADIESLQRELDLERRSRQTVLEQMIGMTKQIKDLQDNPAPGPS